MIEAIREVFDLLRIYGLRCKYAKCKFGYTEITYLGYKLSEAGIQPPDLAGVMSELRDCRPQNLKQLRRVLGMLSFYRLCIPEFSRYCVPLYNLLRKKAQFRRTETEERAYKALVSAFMSPSIMAYHDPMLPVFIETDASDFAISGILKQPDSEGVLKAIVYHGRILKPAEINYTTTEKECLAVIEMLNKYKHLIGNMPVTVVTDHCALCYLMSSKPTSQRIQRWQMNLQHLDLRVVQSKGSNHQLADVLSRNPYENSFDSSLICSSVMTTASEPHVQEIGIHEQNKKQDPRSRERLEEMVFNDERNDEAQENDLFCKEARRQIQSGKTNSFVDLNGLLYYSDEAGGWKPSYTT